jgi:hypothetical protein
LHGTIYLCLNETSTFEWTSLKRIEAQSAGNERVRERGERERNSKKEEDERRKKKEERDLL